MRQAKRQADPDTVVHVLNYTWDCGFYCGIHGLTIKDGNRPPLDNGALRDQFYHGLQSGRQMRAAMTAAADRATLQHEPTPTNEGEDDEERQTSK